jgi:predicted RNA-binding protein YlqC (UPF0109 family)
VSELDQQFIEYVVKSLVGKPDAVHIDRRIDEKGVLLELTVDPEDLGRVIGKRGATAQSLRTLLRALGTKNDARYNLKIIDNGVGPSSASSSKSDDTDTPLTATPSDISQSEDNDQASSPAPAQNNTTSAAEPEDSNDAPEERTSDRLRQAREELADLDDLDL